MGQCFSVPADRAPATPRISFVELDDDIIRAIALRVHSQAALASTCRRLQTLLRDAAVDVTFHGDVPESHLRAFANVRAVTIKSPLSSPPPPLYIADHLTKLTFMDAARLDPCLKSVALCRNLRALCFHSSREKHRQPLDLSDGALVLLGRLRALDTLEAPYATRVAVRSLHHLQRAPLTKLDLSHCSALGNPAVKALSHLSSLASLALSGCTDITNKGLKNLRRLTALTQLDISYLRRVTDGGVEYLAVLKALEICGMAGLQRVSARGLAVIAALPKLRELNVAGGVGESLSDVGVRALARATALQRLDLRLCDSATDDSIQVLTALRALTHISFENGRRAPFKAVHTIALLPALASLTCTNCEYLNDSALTALAARARSLRHLNLDCCPRVTDDGIASVGDALSGIESLSLRYCDRVSDDALWHVGALTRLTCLNLSGCDRVACLSNLLRLKLLQELRLSGCPLITDAALESLTHMPALTHVNLAFCTKVSDASVRWLARLRALRHLKLRGCDRVTDAGVRALKSCLHLRHLNLHGVRVSAAGLAHISGLPALRVLKLQGCAQVGDKALAEVAKMQRLEELCISSCDRVTDAGLRWLAVGLPHLQSIDVSCCMKVTNKGMRALRFVPIVLGTHSRHGSASRRRIGTA